MASPLKHALTPVAATAVDAPLSVRAVIVCELLSRSNIARGADPDRIADDVNVAVRAARVIDESRDVASHRRIANPLAIDLKAPNAPALHVPTFTAQAFAVGDFLPGVIDDAGVLRDRRDGEHAPSMNL